MNIFNCPEFTNSEEFLQKTRNLYYILISIPLLLFALVYLGMKDKTVEPLVPASIYIFIKIGLIVLAVMSGSWGMIYFSRKYRELNLHNNLRQKLCDWYQIFTIRNLWLALSTILAVTGLYFTKAQEFSLIFVVFLILFSIASPTYYRISRTLKLSKEEREIVYKRQPIDPA